MKAWTSWNKVIFNCSWCSKKKKKSFSKAYQSFFFFWIPGISNHHHFFPLDFACYLPSARSPVILIPQSVTEVKTLSNCALFCASTASIIKELFSSISEVLYHLLISPSGSLCRKSLCCTKGGKGRSTKTQFSPLHIHNKSAAVIPAGSDTSAPPSPQGEPYMWAFIRAQKTSFLLCVQPSRCYWTRAPSCVMCSSKHISYGSYILYIFVLNLDLTKNILQHGSRATKSEHVQIKLHCGGKVWGNCPFKSFRFMVLFLDLFLNQKNIWVWSNSCARLGWAVNLSSPLWVNVYMQKSERRKCVREKCNKSSKE